MRYVDDSYKEFRLIHNLCWLTPGILYNYIEEPWEVI